MVKTMSGQLAPLNDAEAEELKKIKTGHVVEVKLTRKRNPDFHRKVMALFQTCFEAWEEVAPHVEYLGQPVKPSFDRLRKDLTILAGYYESTFNLKGEVRLEAKSISFGSMDQDEFELLFSALIDTALRTLLSKRGYSEETLRGHLERVLAFA